jgi:hypothetical protein
MWDTLFACGALRAGCLTGWVQHSTRDVVAMHHTTVLNIVHLFLLLQDAGTSPGATGSPCAAEHTR